MGSSVYQWLATTETSSCPATGRPPVPKDHLSVHTNMVKPEGQAMGFGKGHDILDRPGLCPGAASQARA